jgi:hypothetical protein
MLARLGCKEQVGCLAQGAPLSVTHARTLAATTPRQNLVQRHQLVSHLCQGSWSMSGVTLYGLSFLAWLHLSCWPIPSCRACSAYMISLVLLSGHFQLVACNAHPRRTRGLIVVQLFRQPHLQDTPAPLRVSAVVPAATVLLCIPDLHLNQTPCGTMDSNILASGCAAHVPYYDVLTQYQLMS